MLSLVLCVLRLVPNCIIKVQNYTVALIEIVTKVVSRVIIYLFVIILISHIFFSSFFFLVIGSSLFIQRSFLGNTGRIQFQVLNLS